MNEFQFTMEVQRTRSVIFLSKKLCVLRASVVKNTKPKDKRYA